MDARIVLLPGDGIGPEVLGAARQVLEAIARQFQHRWELAVYPIGGAALDEAGDPLPPETLDAALRADAVLLGAVGGPKWDELPPERRPERGLLALRKAMGTFANLRPLRVWQPLLHLSPLRPEHLRGTDFIVVRELTGGIYFGARQEADARGEAWDTMHYTRAEIARVARIAGELAQQRRGFVVSVDKANVLATSRLWRRTVTEVFQREYPEVRLEHRLVDAMAMDIIRRPNTWDVILTANMFGDILTDEAAALTGTLGTLPSASLGDARNRHGYPRGLYEPIHGSAPDIAGLDIANPSAAMLSVALLLRHSLGLEREAQAVEQAVVAAWASRCLTPDLACEPGNACPTSAFTERVLYYLEHPMG